MHSRERDREREQFLFDAIIEQGTQVPIVVVECGSAAALCHNVFPFGQEFGRNLLQFRYPGIIDEGSDYILIGFYCAWANCFACAVKARVFEPESLSNRGHCVRCLIYPSGKHRSPMGPWCFSGGLGCMGITESSQRKSEAIE